MKFLIQHTEDIYGTPLEIGVVQREKNETLRVPPFLWESLVYETGIAPFFSRMVRKISRRPETVSEQTVEEKIRKKKKSSRVTHRKAFSRKLSSLHLVF
jgi:hypothetical protein